MKGIKYYFSLVLKGIGMGTANVIPGVSGGTIALITGIFEELIDSIKSFNLEALRLLVRGKFKDLSEHINLRFLIAVFFGIGVSIISLARLLDYLFIHYPEFIWAYFFGLILASIYFVGKTVYKWSWSVILSCVTGTVIALSISFFNPATENDGFIYLVICGAIAVCSMILPGLSGSFVLILLGNYHLVFIDAINNVRFGILIPVIVGAAIGLIAFSHILSWIYKKHRNQTISALTGFILGSLAILWPWQRSYDQVGNILTTNKYGAFLDANGEVLTNVKVYSFDQILPQTVDLTFFIAIALIIGGIVSIWLMEFLAGNKLDS